MEEGGAAAANTSRSTTPKGSMPGRRSPARRIQRDGPRAACDEGVFGAERKWYRDIIAFPYAGKAVF